MVILISLVLAAMPATGTDNMSKPRDREGPVPLVGNWPADHAVYRALSLRAVKVGGFLGEHVDASNRRSLLAGLESPIPKAIEARARGEQPPDACKRLATDSDFYKWLEGACYAVAYDPSLHELAAAVDRYVDMLVRIQRADGYIGTELSPARPFDEKRQETAPAAPAVTKRTFPVKSISFL